MLIKKIETMFPMVNAEYAICKSEQPCFIFNTISEAEEFLLKLPVNREFWILEINTILD